MNAEDQARLRGIEERSVKAVLKAHHEFIRGDRFSTAMFCVCGFSAGGPAGTEACQEYAALLSKLDQLVVCTDSNLHEIATLRAEIARLKGALSIASEYPEISLENYNDDDVRLIQDWAFRFIDHARAALAPSDGI